jgi:signal peptidase I
MSNDKFSKKSPSTKKKYLSYLIYLIPIAIIILGYVAIIAATGEGEPFTIVSGPSMQPTIPSGSIEVIAKTPFDQLKVGDIIVFTPMEALLSPQACQSGAPPTLASDANIPCFVIHRIHKISVNSQGQRILETKGDNNEAPICDQNTIFIIDCEINQSMYVGQVVLQFPMAGYITQYPYNVTIASLIILFLIVQFYFERKTTPAPARPSPLPNEQEPRSYSIAN